MEIRNYTSGDEVHILDLFRLSFNREMAMSYWNWRFRDNPFTNDIMIHLMWDEDKLVGHYAICPIQMVIEGELVMTAFSMTTMTHPEYNGRGIFTKLASSLYQELKEKYHYKMVWGFPNNNSHYAFVKNLGWKNVATIPMLTLSADKVKGSFETDCQVLPGFNQSVSDKLNQSTKPIRINLTAEYLDWRYVMNPAADYKIITVGESVVVYKIIPSFQQRGKKEVDILELEFDSDPKLLEMLLSAVKREENTPDIVAFNLWCSIFSDDYLLLKKFGFLSTLPITYLGFANLSSESDLPGDYRNWDLSFGYSDVF